MPGTQHPDLPAATTSQLPAKPKYRVTTPRRVLDGKAVHVPIYQTRSIKPVCCRCSKNQESQDLPTLDSISWYCLHCETPVTTQTPLSLQPAHQYHCSHLQNPSHTKLSPLHVSTVDNNAAQTHQTHHMPHMVTIPAIPHRLPLEPSHPYVAPIHHPVLSLSLEVTQNTPPAACCCNQALRSCCL
jgi:hypothetical protein